MYKKAARKVRIEVLWGKVQMIKNELQYIMPNEKLVNEALRIALGEINATSSIEKFLEKLGSSMHCDRIYIFEGKCTS